MSASFVVVLKHSTMIAYDEQTLWACSVETRTKTDAYNISLHDIALNHIMLVKSNSHVVFFIHAPGRQKVDHNH